MRLGGAHARTTRARPARTGAPGRGTSRTRHSIPRPSAKASWWDRSSTDPREGRACSPPPALVRKDGEHVRSASFGQRAPTARAEDETRTRQATPPGEPGRMARRVKSAVRARDDPSDPREPAPRPHPQGSGARPKANMWGRGAHRAGQPGARMGWVSAPPAGVAVGQVARKRGRKASSAPVSRESWLPRKWRGPIDVVRMSCAPPQGAPFTRASRRH